MTISLFIKLSNYSIIFELINSLSFKKIFIFEQFKSFKMCKQPSNFEFSIYIIQLSMFLKSIRVDAKSHCIIELAIYNLQEFLLQFAIYTKPLIVVSWIYSELSKSIRLSFLY